MVLLWSLGWLEGEGNSSKGDGGLALGSAWSQASLCSCWEFIHSSGFSLDGSSGHERERQGFSRHLAQL